MWRPTGRWGLTGDGSRDLPWTPRQVAIAVRGLILALVLILAELSDDRVHALLWLIPIAGLAALTSVRRWNAPAQRLLAVITSLVAVVAILDTGNSRSPIFPYLVAPAFTAALGTGIAGALLGPGIAGLALVVAGAIANRGEAYALSCAEWVVLALAAGLTGAWIRYLLGPDNRPPEQVDTSYAAAYRLLAQLRPVARQLSVGLDPVTIAEGLLQSLRQMVEFERGAVLVRTGGDRLVPLAHLGGAREDWDVDVTGDSAFAEAWLSQRPQRLGRQFSGAPGGAVVVPLVIGVRSFGLVGLETRERSVGPQDTTAMAGVVEEAALRLETAMLFDEVRGVATAEERRRLAREIHDGIAQELSYLGYVVDGLAADARDSAPEITDQLKGLRAEITRIVSELRLSIFDLRSEVDVHGGLGAALSEYVRSVGQQSHLTVHLSLDEAATRLPAETEAELLRIAQEAITNARKHAEAHNLWVTLVVDPPGALLRVEDDGRGLGRARVDSYGLQIMRERASRLRTEVRVGARTPNGTTVEVVLGGASGRGTRLSADQDQPARVAAEEMPTT